MHKVTSPFIIPPSRQDGSRKIRVAAYCRVSTTLPSQDSSFKNQEHYYRELISSAPDWIFAGIYSDHGITASKSRKRPGLDRLLQDCRSGQIDLVLTKSISRLSRNTFECLTIIQELLSCGVTISFETERINTGSTESGLLLALLCAIAQQESSSISQNVKWRIRSRFQDGTYIPAHTPYGYRRANERYLIDPKEGRVIRRIFLSVLSGNGAEITANALNKDQIPSPCGKQWRATSILAILKNPFYMGTLLYQKTYTDDHFKQSTNRGEQDQYFIPCSHPPIISGEEFRLAGKIIRQHGILHKSIARSLEKPVRYCFSGKLICGECGDVLTRGGGDFYRCRRPQSEQHKKIRIYTEDMEAVFATMLNKLSFAVKHADSSVYAKIVSSFPPSVFQHIRSRGILAHFTESDRQVFTHSVSRAVIRCDRTVTVVFTNGLVLSEHMDIPG